jgi:hypothetical protein
MIVYLACSFSDDEWGINDVERPAYEQGNHYEQCCYLHGGIVCDCHNDPPTFNAAALDGLVANCPELVRTSSGFTFWKMVWGCVPGLSKLWDWTQELIQKACKFDWQPGRTPEGLPGPSQPTWNDVQRFFASCMWAILAWLILRFIALLYYAVWLAIWTLLTIIAGIIKTAIEVIIIAVDVLLWVVTTIVCGAEWLWDKIKEGFQAACNWGTKTKKSCEQWGEQYRQECTATEEQSTQECTQKEDQGHQDCCDWWPCSWACDAWVWVSHWVCVAWAWVTKTVCVAWSWVAESVCVAFTWVVIKVTCW